MVDVLAFGARTAGAVVERAMNTSSQSPNHPLRLESADGDVPLPFPECLDDVLAAWRRYGVAASHSGRTIASRAGTVRLLARDGIDPMTVTRDELVDWLGELTARDGSPLSRATRATYRTHLRAWCAWLVEDGRRIDDPAARLPTARVPRGVPHPLTPAEVDQVLAACSHPSAAQTRSYVLLAAYAGLRAHEIAKVRGEDVHGSELRVVGKGGVSSTVPLSPVLQRLAGQSPASGWWFPTWSASGHVHRSTVSAAIQRAFRRAGIVAVPHALRHFYCTEVLRSSGGDLRTTQRAARHASPATTAIYTQVADETLTRAIFGIPGAA